MQPGNGGGVDGSLNRIVRNHRAYRRTDPMFRERLSGSAEQAHASFPEARRATARRRAPAAANTGKPDRPASFTTAPPRQIPLTSEQIDEIMAAQWTHARSDRRARGPESISRRCGLGGLGGPSTFFARGQKIVNLRRNPACTVNRRSQREVSGTAGHHAPGALGRVLEDAGGREGRSASRRGAPPRSA